MPALRRLAEPAPGSLGKLMALVSIAVAIGCQSPNPPVAQNTPPVARNLVLISIDTLRADHLGCYGYPLPTSPALDRLAEEGVLWERALANSPWTLPSHASILTGLFPRSHGVISSSATLPEQIPTLASVLAAAGFQTLGLVNSPQLLSRHGLDRGFTTFKYFPAREEGRRIRSAHHQVDQAITWLAASEQPFFLFLHNYDVHSAYDPSPEFANIFARPFAGQMQATTAELIAVRQGKTTLSAAALKHVIDLYDGGIREVDSALSRLFGFFESSGLAANTVIILTSDHGEELLDHGGVLHGRTMYRELLHVPLIMRGPGVAAGRRVDRLAQPSDILPTALAMLGIAAPQKRDGQSLIAATRDQAERILGERWAFAEADHNRPEGDNTLAMVQNERFKLILDLSSDRTELFDHQRDPDERSDLARFEPDTVRHLRSRLDQYLAHGQRQTAEASPLSERDREELRALGYLN